MKSNRIALALSAALPVGLLAAACAEDTPPPGTEIAGSRALDTDVYIVRMMDDPVVAYEGGIPGLPATRPSPGLGVDPDRAAVARYAAHLDALHDAALSIAGGRKLYDYRFSFNGMAAVLTRAQAAALAAAPGVSWVERDEARQLITDNTPSFLSLDAPAGLWSRLGGVDHAGEDVIIGLVDTGVWPEHPSFADEGAGVQVYGPPPARWRGACQTGERWSEDDCNNKLIGARYYADGFLEHGDIGSDVLSARDVHGHGTHTASTAGGNRLASAVMVGVDRGPVSGMAPRARIATYKACWANAGCYLSDLTMAIDRAVADGVDVISYSIGSALPKLDSPDAWAFLHAQNAGVFVAVAAGNAGPRKGSVGSPAAVPWVTSVAATTQDRDFESSVTLLMGASEASFQGVSITDGSGPPRPIVDAAAAAVDPASVPLAEVCTAGKLDPAKVTGAIVLCKRGGNGRLDKSLAVQQAGGAGMILYNTDDRQPLAADPHCIPSLHVSATTGTAIKARIGQQGVTASIDPGRSTPIAAPWMAAFSSRGPDRAALDILKPDVTAPGVNVLAGGTPEPMVGPGGQLFRLMNGTSMATPHVAGVAALLRQAHPDWTPAMIRSALVTTADHAVKKEDGQRASNPFDVGGGHIAPGLAVDPGLVYDAGARDYTGFLCAIGLHASLMCPLLAIDPSDLNLPSITVSSLTGTKTVTRRIKNVGEDEAYRLIVEAPPGIDARTSVSAPLGAWNRLTGTLSLRSGATATYRVTFAARPEAARDAWTFGAITWASPRHRVRSPIAVRPVAP